MSRTSLQGMIPAAKFIGKKIVGAGSSATKVRLEFEDGSSLELSTLHPFRCEYEEPGKLRYRSITFESR